MQHKYMGYTASKLIGTAGIEIHDGEFHIVSSSFTPSGARDVPGRSSHLL